MQAEGGSFGRGLPSLTRLLPSELHKISLLTSSWLCHHFPKALYFYRALCLLANSRSLDGTRAQGHPRKASPYSPAPSSPPPFSVSQSSQGEEAGPFRWLPPGADLEPLSPGGFLRRGSNLSQSSCGQGARDSGGLSSSGDSLRASVREKGEVKFLHSD